MSVFDEKIQQLEDLGLQRSRFSILTVALIILAMAVT